jgi:phosphoribosylcarboxyaminoimidazole (NCAIR) mutase
MLCHNESQTSHQRNIINIAGTAAPLGGMIETVLFIGCVCIAETICCH